MNMKQQRNYLKSVTPEIKQAIRAEYPTGTRYFNTKHIFKQIVTRPDDHPILFAKSRKHIMDCITTFLKELPNSSEWSSRNHKSGGKVYFVPNSSKFKWLRRKEPATVPAG
jgi:uncharacterized protein YaiE (UPF0345 family)